MAAKSGKLVVLQLGTTSPVTIATARTNSLTINHTVVDTTTKADNGWSSTLPGGGITEMTINVEGIYTGGNVDQSFRALGVSGDSAEYTITDGFGDKFTGNFVCSTYGIGGTYNEAETFQATLKNDGAIVFTANV